MENEKNNEELELVTNEELESVTNEELESVTNEELENNDEFNINSLFDKISDDSKEENTTENTNLDDTVEIHYNKNLEPHSTSEIELAEIKERAEKMKEDTEISEEPEEPVINKPVKEKKPFNKKIVLIIIGVLVLIGLVVGLILLFNNKTVSKKPEEIKTKAECEKYKYHWWEAKKACYDIPKPEKIDNEEECKEFGYNWWYKQKVCSSEKAKLSIIDEKSKTRPFAVMINNHNQARPYHSSLDKANIVYEIIVEGGITRLMAVFKDKDLERIGSVRSSRHYFLDYALENDAIYVHFGWSPQAEADMSSLGVNNVNGLYDNGFYRDLELPVDYEHTAQISTEAIKSVANYRKYRMDYKSDNVLDEQVLKYSVDKIDLSGHDDSIVANNITIPYSSYMTSSYTYDKDNEYYLRFANGAPHTDYLSKEQYHFKNIIVINVRNYSIDNYGRQGLDNIGNGTGYFITNGYARPITWEKSSRSAKTVYKYLDGEEIVVNDDNTFIQIQPISMSTEIS